MRMLSQIIVASLVTVKIIVGSLFVYEIGFGGIPLEGNAIASERRDNPEGGATPARNRAPDPAPQQQGARQDSSAATLEGKPTFQEEELDLNFLREKKAQLEERERDIEKQRNALLVIQDDLSKKIAALTQLRDEIRAEMERKKTFDEMRLRHIVKAYSTMKPKVAADLIDKLDIDFAIELLSNMKGDIVGDILSFLDAQKAANISEELARKK